MLMLINNLIILLTVENVLDCLQDQVYKNFNFFLQYLSAKKAATPLLIQRSSSYLVGSSMYITKFVLCPVVDKVPDLLTTLYNGQLYMC